MSEIDEAEVEQIKAAIYDALYAETMRSAPFDAAGVRASRDRVARAVLADLSSRWHLVPREGEERTEWGVQYRSGSVERYPEARAFEVAWLAPQFRLLVRRTVRTIPDDNGGTWVHTSAWEPVEEAKP